MAITLLSAISSHLLVSSYSISVACIVETCVSARVPPSIYHVDLKLYRALS
jgi:hypothetical protein